MRGYRVHASLSTREAPYRNCQLLKPGEVAVGGHIVFGPADEEECRRFIAQNCGTRG